MANFTDRVEDMIKQESERFQEQLKSALDEAPRPVGSKRVPYEQRLMEFELMMDAPEVFVEFLKDQNASIEEAIRYAHKMQKRVKRGKNG
jgi:hypothetical protein